MLFGEKCSPKLVQINHTPNSSSLCPRYALDPARSTCSPRCAESIRATLTHLDADRWNWFREFWEKAIRMLRRGPCVKAHFSNSNGRSIAPAVIGLGCGSASALDVE